MLASWLPTAFVRHRTPLLLAGLLLIAGVLRAWDLGGVPPGLYCDEVALGVNARCLAEDGSDLKGERWPVYVHEATFELYGSRRIVYQPIYQYSLLPFVKCFGLSAASIRWPSVLWGLAGIAAAFALGRELFGTPAGLAAAASLALSPWHQLFSRVCLEVVSLTPLLALGVLALFQGLERPRRLAVGMGILALSTYAYPAARLFVPLLVLGFALFHARELRRPGSGVLPALAVALVVGLPNLYLLLTDPNQGRMNSLFIFKVGLEREAAVRYLDASAFENWWASILLDHAVLRIPFVFLYNYATLQSPAFLFLSGDPNVRHALQGLGMYPLFTLPLYAAGLVVLVRRRRDPRCRFLLLWLLLWPVASSLTVDSPHAIRAFVALPAIDLVMALGLLELLAAASAPAAEGWTPRLATVFLWFCLLRAPYEVYSYQRHLHDGYPGYSHEAWDGGIEAGFHRIAEHRRPGETVHVSSSVHNAWLNVLFFAPSPGPLPARSPDGPPEPPLPPGFRVVRPRRLARLSTSAGLWLLKAPELSEMKDAVVLSELRHPDGRPNLVLARTAPPGDAPR
jgi:hypothetical protein